jgi:DNA-binding response OmpR family regulator
MKILVVEDDPVICRAIEATFNCDCATDGWDAIEKLETSDYAAIIIDTDVPRHSGYGVITYLRQENGDSLSNVLLMTTADRASVLHRTSEHMRVIETTEAVDEIAAALGSDRQSE